MELPVLNGIIDRRILVNYRVAPDVIQKFLPSHLSPLVINGYASAGICLLRLKNIGIKRSPGFMRITSENAAHRFLVKYYLHDQEYHGVYIPRRDTDSMLNVWLAGRLFSWPHYLAKFSVAESNGLYDVKMRSDNGQSQLRVQASQATSFPTDSMFSSLEHASSCFKNCPVGFSPSTIPDQIKSIRLETRTWAVSPLIVHRLESEFYDNRSLFPKGSISFDNALLMEGIEHEWKKAPAFSTAR